MAENTFKKLIDIGLKAADSKVFHEDKTWSRYSNDKVDIGEHLARVIRTLLKDIALSTPLRALSIGSSNEPQFRLLETFFRGGLYLMDIEKEALDIIKERIKRQNTDHVETIQYDFNKIFLSAQKTRQFLKVKLKGKKVNLITLHHSMYYCRREDWMRLFENLYRYILAPKGAIHAVLMSARDPNAHTTTWLYEHFTGKFYGLSNTQDLSEFSDELRKCPLFKTAQVYLKKSRVQFIVGNFARFMAVIWMILLYPNVHRYTPAQKKEIIKFIYDTFWKKKKPLLQTQDHLAIYRGMPFRGLV